MKRTGKNNLIYLMALILVIIAFIAFATYGMLDGSKDEEWYPVSVAHFPVLRKSTRSFTGRSIMEQRA